MTQRGKSYSLDDRDGTVIYGYTAEQLYGLAYECAGVGSGAVMAEAPDVVMPTEVIREGLRRVLEVERRIPPPKGYR